MKKVLAFLSVLTLTLSMASCGGEEGNTSSVTSTGGPASSVITPTSNVSIPVIELPSAPDEPDNLAAEGTAFDHNEGLKNGDEGWYDYYERATASESLATNITDGNATTGWQPMGTDGDEATPVTYNNDAEEGFFEEDVEGTVTKKYNLHEGSEAIPEGWYFANDEKTEIRRYATYEDGKVFAGVKFEEAVKADCLVLSWEYASRAVAYEDGGFYLEYTTDGEKWEKLEATIAREDVEGATTTDTATFEAVEAKGFRVVALKCINKWGTKLWEFELYAPEAETEESTETSSEVAE